MMERAFLVFAEKFVYLQKKLAVKKRIRYIKHKSYGNF